MKQLRLGDPLEPWLGQFLSHLSVDCVVFGFHGDDLKLLLLKWKDADVWVLPGGYVGLRQSLDDAAHEVLRQRTGLRRVHLRQFQAFGGLGRKEGASRRFIAANSGDVSRDLWVFKRVVSVGYYALVDYPEVRPTPDAMVGRLRVAPARRASPAGVRPRRDRRARPRRVAGRAGETGRGRQPDARTVHDAGAAAPPRGCPRAPLDRRNFQKRMLERGGIERLSERRTGGAHRAPYLYRFTVPHAGLDF